MPVSAELQLILDVVDDPIAVYDREWRYTYVNRSAARTLGRAPEDLLGRSIWELFPDAVGNQFHRELHQVAASGQAIHSDHYYAPFDRWFENHIYPVPDGILVLSRDVTRERQDADTLRQREQMLRLAQKAGGVATFEWDFREQIAYCSAEFFRIFGLPETDGVMTSSEWAAFVHPEDRERMAVHLARVLHGEEPAATDYRIHSADGQTRWLTYSGRLHQRQAGSRMLGTVVDITERKRTEDALRVSEERLQIALDAAQMVAWDWDVASGRMTLSPSAAAVLGLSAAHPIHSAVDGLSHVVPEDRDAYERIVRAALGHAGSWRTEFRFVRPSDGRVIWLEDRGRVKTDDVGRPVSASGVLFNITGRVEAQQQAARLAYMLEATPDFVALATADGRLTYVNAAGRRMVGMTADADVTAFHQSQFAPAWVAERTRDVWLPAAVKDGAAFGEAALLTVDGREIPVSFVLLVHRDPSGHIEYVSTIARDISERKILEEQLRAHADELATANRLKDEFLATLSHELRTPLNVVRGRLSMLTTATDLASVRRAADVIERNSIVLERLVGDLLDVARLSRGDVRLDRQDVAIGSVVTAAVQAVQAAADAKRIEIACALPDGAAPVWADATRLEQVVWNLLSNAVKFTPDGGRVTVDVGRRDERLVLRVSDTGIGLDATALTRVFDRFWQADGRSTRRFGGLGLGLSIARQLVQLHGGDIRAESEGPGTGATFTVELPAGS